MKKFLFLLFVLISSNTFAQKLQVKEGSFKHIPNGIIEDKDTYIDGQGREMALIKISTENINEKERLNIVFNGNSETQIIKKAMTGQVWLYISAETAVSLDIKHPDYEPYKYYFPEKLCKYCVYEMVLQYTEKEKECGLIIIKSEPDNAYIYIDGEYYGETFKIINIEVGTHEIVLTKKGYNDKMISVAVNKDEKLNINEKLEKKFISGQNAGYDYIDLGLSVKWATCNIGADKIEEYGDYYAWGETKPAQNNNYNSENCSLIGSNIIEICGNSKYDAATACWRGEWRMPTVAEFKELRSGCTWELTTHNGIYGVLGTSKYNGNNIFLPLAGYYDNSLLKENEKKGHYWISQPYEVGKNAYCMIIDGSAGKKMMMTITSTGVIEGINATLQWSDYMNGLSVRPVFKQQIDGHEYVDLGLSVKWAACNIGAEKHEDFGCYFAWGETKPKNIYKEGNSSTLGKNMSDISNNAKYDAATAIWGGKWRTPTYNEWQELLTQCTWNYTEKNGVAGYIVTGPNGNCIFLPAAGYYKESTLKLAGSQGFYWSSTPDKNDKDSSLHLSFNKSNQGMLSGSRYNGPCVRPVTD